MRVETVFVAVTPSAPEEGKGWGREKRERGKGRVTSVLRSLSDGSDVRDVRSHLGEDGDLEQIQYSGIFYRSVTEKERAFPDSQICHRSF